MKASDFKENELAGLEKEIDQAIALAEVPGVILTTFGDMLTVPGTPAADGRGAATSLERLRSQGADVRVVYSCLDSLEIAAADPDKKIVFMGVGFETTSPTVAATVLAAKRRGIRNFFVLANFKRLFPALNILACSKDLKIDGFICPGHVSVITGSRPYEKVARRSKKPCVITGFEPADIFKSIERLLRQIEQGAHKVEIAYDRAVTKSGNKKALEILNRVFKPCAAEWRGLGPIADSGLKFRPEFKDFDARGVFTVRLPAPKKIKGCICAEVIQGLSGPGECKLFKKVCSPQNPVGPCMVSSEGACAAAFKYGVE